MHAMGAVLSSARSTDDGRRVAAVLRAVRRERGLTQQQVADGWGLTVDGYRPWERGERSLRVSQLPSLAQALGVSEDDLAGRLGMAPQLTQYAFTPEMTEILHELSTLPPEMADQLLAMWRHSLQITRLAQKSREN